MAFLIIHLHVEIHGFSRIHDSLLQEFFISGIVVVLVQGRDINRIVVGKTGVVGWSYIIQSKISTQCLSFFCTDFNLNLCDLYICIGIPVFLRVHRKIEHMLIVGSEVVMDRCNLLYGNAFLGRPLLLRVIFIPHIDIIDIFVVLRIHTKVDLQIRRVVTHNRVDSGKSRRYEFQTLLVVLHRPAQETVPGLRAKIGRPFLSFVASLVTIELPVGTPSFGIHRFREWPSHTVCSCIGETYLGAFCTVRAVPHISVAVYRH